MSWWLVLSLYVVVLLVLAVLAIFILRYAADDDRLVRRKGVSVPKPQPLIRPLSRQAVANLRARVAAQHRAATRAGGAVWGKTVTRAKARPRIGVPKLRRGAVPGQTAPEQAVPEQTVSEQAVPGQITPADTPETVAAADE